MVTGVMVAVADDDINEATVELTTSSTATFGRAIVSTTLSKSRSS